MYGALSYDPKATGVEFLHDTSGGLFEWPLEVNRYLGLIKNQVMQKEKTLLLVDYLVELCYDLALAPMYNVSRSTGFEAFLPPPSLPTN
jgi:hypothetical protein